jgi:cytochrome P450
VRDVYRSPDRFSNVGKAAGNIYRLPPETRERIPSVVLVETTPALSSADPPVHTRQRALVMKPLTPRQLARKREWLEALCDSLVDELTAADAPDLIKHFTFGLTYRSILGLFGAPLEHVPVFEEATHARQQFVGLRGANEEAALRYERAVVALREAVESIYPIAREEDDEGAIIASLLRPEKPEHALEPDEMFVLLKIFFAAGQENIIYSVATAIHELLRNPAQLELVKADPSLAVAAYEEAVRFDTPAQSNPRIATADQEFAGRQIRAGDQLLNVKGSANRDAAVWTEPDRFDLRRNLNEPEGGTVAFGQGPHFCAGAGVARLAGPIAIQTLLRRVQNIRLLEGWEPRWIDNPLNRKLAELPLRLA